MSFGLQQTRAGIGGQRRSKCGEETDCIASSKSFDFRMIIQTHLGELVFCNLVYLGYKFLLPLSSILQTGLFLNVQPSSYVTKFN